MLQWRLRLSKDKCKNFAVFVSHKLISSKDSVVHPTAQEHLLAVNEIGGKFRCEAESSVAAAKIGRNLCITAKHTLDTPEDLDSFIQLSLKRAKSGQESAKKAFDGFQSVLQELLEAIM